MTNTEYDIYYAKANRKAKARFSERVSNGESGYLTSLDQILDRKNIETEIYAGLFEVPLYKIKGTYTYSRAKAFSDNFMPLLDEGTEFNQKWVTLYASHLKEGIRDPIKVYEYLNWYYVVEGNKRVSVLKSIEAYSIYGYVTRLVPKYDENNPIIKKYYKYLNFTKKTGLRWIWFSKPENFDELLSLFNQYHPRLKIYDDKYKHFENYVYANFRRAYKNAGGDILSITTGDAILKYLKLYGIPQEFNEYDKDKFMRDFVSELSSISLVNQKKVYSEPILEPKKNVMTTLTSLVSSKKKYKIGFIYQNNVRNNGWTYAHDSARRYVAEIYKDRITTSYIENVPSSLEAYEYIKKLVKEKNDIIITTHPTFKNATLKAALEFPNVKFLNCSNSPSFKHVIMYYARIYESKFLIGLLAGILTNSNNIGYVVGHPIKENITEINAFALGVQLLNPNAKVVVKWTLDQNYLSIKDDVKKYFSDKNVDLVFYNTLPVSGDDTLQFGLCNLDGNRKRDESYAFSHYANLILNWEMFYDKFISLLLNSSSTNFSEFFSNNSDIVNYWLGIDSGIVDIVYSSKYVPERTKVFMEFFRKTIIKKDFHPFTGPIYDQEGALRINKEKTATYEQLQSMDWFVKGVDGKIPPLKEEIINNIEL
ncbi:hypothetical protein SH2C18_01160 [Clostridium sediminicola]|uniref:BMP family ABC transporter substrate-binding protein n=1 Tax=Clostridium sediminicola TaxID=3114879 RepID=UPI0031F20A8F